MDGRRASIVRRVGYAPALIAALAVLSLAAAQSAPVTVSESGSTLIFPLFKAWVAAYAENRS